MLNSLSFADLGLVFVIILLSMAAHEAMHAYAAHALGDTTAKDEGRLTLNPLKHVDILTTVLLPVVMILAHLPPIFAARPVPFDPMRVKFAEYGAALVALAGPFTNLALAVVASLFVRIIGGDGDSGLLHVVLLFMQINIMFFVFNMLPIPPLDGSRLLYAFAPDPVREVMERIERAGILIILFVLILLAQFGLLTIISNISNAIFTFLLR
jgi:Zn-dependent protease